MKPPVVISCTDLICCPEDKECKAGCSEHHACARCWIPVCASCREQAGKGAIPKEALANDMVVYYAPRELYEFKVTMLELVCASPCLTSLICFSLEKKYRNQRTLDERVHMQRHRQGARGNATTFLLDWESLLAQFRGYEVNLAPQARAPLPRTGEDLQKFVSVILKTSDTELTPEELSKLIHQARVRRRVVIMLIEKACEREHPAFRELDLAQVRLRAERELPEDGVPPEVVAVLPCDDNLQQIEKQKVAAPVAAPATVQEAALDLDLKRPNAVVLEKTGLEDYEAQRFEAVRALAEVAEEDLRDSGSEQEDGPAPETDVVSRSTPMNQFAPWYFGVAFAYMFQYCTAMPDPPSWGEFRDKRWRRPPEAPHIGLADWVRTMSRRVESQLGRDWTFGYTTWNVLFRSAVNLSRSVYSYDTPVLQDSGEWGKLTAAALENAAIEILRALKGTYATPDGRRLPVNGSLTLAKYATGLSATARRILANMNHTARVIPGTQEARRQMRFEIQGMRARYGRGVRARHRGHKPHGGQQVGTSQQEQSRQDRPRVLHGGHQWSSSEHRVLQSTWRTSAHPERCPRTARGGTRVAAATDSTGSVTPDEGHQLLYIRLSRHRRSDPIRLVEVGAAAAAGDRAWPALDADFTCSLPVECLEPRVPNWEERRRILARDPLATVDGFRVTMLLLLRHLFGMSTCLYCPDCSCGPTPCQDNRGSNAKTNGGVFGRCDAAYVAVEFQKSSGSGHGHIQLFVQCLHQHESLREIFAATSERAAALREAYLHYTSHVRRCIYDRNPVEVTAALHAAEQRWPEYKSERRLISRPRYQAGVMAAENSDEEAELWTEAYLREDVFWLQVLKQHHVHLPDPVTGERTPQPGCLKADNPRDCKSGFPRDAEVTDEAAVMCPCRLQARDMPASGRKNSICTLQGPRDEAYLNGTHPAILAFGRCNSDVQLPYRLPCVCDVCASPTDPRELQEIVTAAQRAQDAQTGYCCDYCAKTQPMAFAELKELQKGHARLAEQTKGRGVEYQGKRHMTRFLSDAYCKGIVRGQAECCNLRCNYKDGDAACAERITTTQYVTFPGRDFLRYADLAITGETEHRRRVTAMSLGRSKHVPRQRQLAEREPAEFYARRPRNSACWHLSPYEFLLYWQVVPTQSPATLQEWKTQPRSTWDVVLTKSGEEKLRAGGGKRVRLVPGKDTRLRVEPSGDTLAFEDIPTNARVRAAWLLRRRRRPRCPTFGHCPVPRYQQECQEENSKLCMVYFRAWTGMPQHADRDVPHIADLQGSYLAWETAFRAWLQELPCQETKQHIGNFLSVYRVRSLAADAENSDNDGADTSAVRVTADNLATSLTTRKTEKNGVEAPDAEYADLEQTWRAEQTNEGKPGRALAAENTLDVRELVKEARKAPQGGAEAEDAVAEEALEREPTVRTRGIRATVRAVHEWVTELRTRVDEKGRPICNRAQHAFIERVARRVVEEMQTGEAQGGARSGLPDAMRWVLHGGPGTGKTHAVKLLRKELFEDILGWSQGLQFQFAALQAVTAEMVDGDTLHHAFGLSWGQNAADTTPVTKGLQQAQRMLQLRWLIIDEISMVSVELLAKLEQACRRVIRNGSPFKRDAANVDKPFGGLNVLVVGDLWQLEPPKGHFIADLPHEWLGSAGARQRPLLAQGQELMWGPPELAFQGCTELEECERTKDEWLKELQDEFRFGQLSADNHAFLHGRPTRVPGSWLRGRAGCGQAKCQCLGAQQVTPETILAEECARCCAERASRRLVAESSHDPRFLGRFVLAPSIFATNVRKCHTNKIRAEAFARRTKRHLHYVVAQDCACAAVVREKPDLAEQKLLWLQRHDRECGELCGMLPLCDGMPVLLTDHLNRARGLLKGRRGFVTGWRHATDGAEPAGPGCTVWNQLPEVVYVRFPGAKWRITGLATGVYPVVPKRATWHLDAGRKSPVLAVRRRQLPLIPAFAMTAHQAQGQTLEEGIVADLCYGAYSNVLAAYVALTRVTSREGVLILRPFDAAPFQQGDTSFRALLMQHLRTHDVNWDAIVQRYVRVKTCSECRTERLKSAFTQGQWKQPDGAAICKECTKSYRERGTPYRCKRCKRWQAPEAFPGKISNYLIWQSTCLMCLEKRQCGACAHWFPQAAFTPNGWRQKRDRTCNVCRQKLQCRDIGLRARRRLHNRQETVRAADRSRKRQQILQEVRAEIEKRQKQGSSTGARCRAQVPAATKDGCRACAACGVGTNSETGAPRELAPGGGLHNRRASPACDPAHARCFACTKAVATEVQDGRVCVSYECPQCKVQWGAGCVGWG